MKFEEIRQSGGMEGKKIKIKFLGEKIPGIKEPIEIEGKVRFVADDGLVLTNLEETKSLFIKTKEIENIELI